MVDDLLDTSNDADGQTIWTAVRPIVDNLGVGRLVAPTRIGDIALLPGDIRLSEFEEFLSDAWADCFKRRLGALRATSSISDLVSSLDRQERFDFTFYDAGPNIGPLNRILLLDSDYFIVPVACDLFSVRALSTLGQTIKKWIIDTRTIRSIAPRDALSLPGAPKFLGYVPQRFRVYGQAMTADAQWYLREIRQRVYGDVSAVLRQIDTGLAPAPSMDPVIGRVKDVASLVQRAQREGVAIWECSASDNKAKEEVKQAFMEIASEFDAAAGGATAAGQSKDAT